MEKITAPFTPEQVENLNTWQRAGWVHPFTCGRCRDRDMAGALAKHGNDFAAVAGELHEERVLVATEDGWVCPTCDYTQDWAHDFMTMPLRWRPPWIR